MKACRIHCLLVLSAVCGKVLAADQDFGTVIDVPPPPPMVDSLDPVEVEEDEELAPEITIIQRRDATHEEYRLNGRLYMVKVTPTVGLPYYFIDRDGDGLMETRMNDHAWEIKVPQWVIFSW